MNTPSNTSTDREPVRSQDDRDTGAVVVASHRALFDRDSGRIDNWSDQ